LNLPSRPFSKVSKNVTEGTDPANTFVFIAGGFGASPWLFRQVKRDIATRRLKLLRPDTQTNKAVAVGAISYYLDHFVVGRIVRYTYGTPASTPYESSDPEHHKRAYKKYMGITGVLQLDIFAPSLFKGMRVSGTHELRDKISGIGMHPPAAGETSEFTIFRYTGKSKNPQWMDEEPSKFKEMCRISVDASKAPYIVSRSLLGFPIFIQEFEIIYIYGQTEFRAQVAWTEEDMEKRSDIAVMYDNEEPA